MTGLDATAQVTPGVNWISGCSDPRFPGGACPLGTPGLMEAIFAAWGAYRTASQAASASFPSGPTIFEINRSTTFGALPDYRTPYAWQFNIGLQRELRPGLVLSVDYVFNRGMNYPLERDFNRVGAADTFNMANALAAMNAVQANLGCPLGPAGVNCAIASRTTIEAYAANGLGFGESAALGTPNFFAFPGMNPDFNHMQLTSMSGRSSYNALQVAVKGRLPSIKTLIRDWNILASYSLSRLEAAADDQFSSSSENSVNNDNPMAFFGPTNLDRTHIFSVGNLFRVPGGVRLNSIWRATTALPQSVFVPRMTGSGAEIFYTDYNGDGTTGDPLPGTNRGSYGRSLGCGAVAINRAIDRYNSTTAGHLTPAGQALVNSGLFTPLQLQTLGAVAPSVPRAPAGQVCLDSFINTDVRISRPIKLWRERITIEPALELFNLFNVANYDMPGNKLLGLLNGAPGSINGTTPGTRSNRAGFGGGSFSQGAPRSWQLALRITF